ncbi:MAG: DEAD/DEAH box helicase [Desulfohalobiaceae bacterium]
MPVQKKTIPYLLAGRDIMVQARTGSGKTGAFVLPLIQLLDPSAAHCQALVLVPTRELARQVAEEAQLLIGEKGLRVIAVYGGVGYQAQLEAFKQGAHLVVGTPGRVLDHLMKHSLILDQLRVLIFDEADRMLSVGFYPDMKDIQRYLPRKRPRASMFSATFPQTVVRLAEEFLHQPELISLSGQQVHVAEIEHEVCEVPSMNKDRALISLIEIENPSAAIVFCNTKNNVEYLTTVLKQYGFDVEEISSSLTQSKREQVLGRLRKGSLRFLVATDVAARGIDIPGTVITLVDKMERLEMERIARRYGIDMVERKAPEEGEVISAIETRLTALLEHKRRKLSQIQAQRVTRFIPSARRFAQDEEGLHLLAMLLDDLYQQSLQSAAPEPEVAEPGREKTKQQHRPGGGKSRGRSRRR